VQEAAAKEAKARQEAIEAEERMREAEERMRIDMQNAEARRQRLKNEAANAISNAELNAANQVAQIDSKMQGLQNAIDSANNAL